MVYHKDTKESEESCSRQLALTENVSRYSLERGYRQGHSPPRVDAYDKAGRTDMQWSFTIPHSQPSS
jgi:hypothetical protein